MCGWKFAIIFFFWGHFTYVLVEWMVAFIIAGNNEAKEERGKGRK